MNQREEFEKHFLYSGLADKDKQLCKGFWNKGFLCGAESAKAQAAPRWIPVSERLPDEFTAVLVYDVDGTHGHVYTLKVYAEFFSKFKSVTHWMPLPAAPEQNK